VANPNSPSTSIVPQLATPFVDETGAITLPWQRFLINLFLLVGGSRTNPAQAVILSQDPSDLNIIQAFNALTGKLVGNISLESVPGGPAEPQVPGASPFVFKALIAGMLGVQNGQVEFSRDSGATWFTLSLVGGAIPVQLNDLVRITWFGTNAPQVTFFPFA
jgi:hypothetical protein